MECHAQYINRGQLAGRGRLLLRLRSAGGEQLHCTSLVFSWVLFLFFVIFLFITIIIIIIVVVVVVVYFTY